MNIVGPPLGKVSIVPDSYPEWNINQAISIFRTNLISSRFLATYLAHEDTVRVMMKKSKATAGQFNLTLEICRETLIPFCGKNEQAEIENLIDAKTFGIDQLDQTITTALQQAEALRQSILKKAFSGQLVPQDPSDEPASVLLERIRLEKAALSVKPKSIKPKRCSL
jgi:type I restriction enzyme S subunit